MEKEELKQSVFKTLNGIDVNEHTEKKNGLTYLSWPWAWATVKGLYQCIDVLIQGGNICERCEDYEECQLKAKEEGKGCEDWSMKDIELTEEEYDSKGIDAASPTGRG